MARSEESAGAVGHAPAPASPAQDLPSVMRDWPAEAAARIEDVVGLVRDRSVRPVQQGVRWLIFGFLSVFLLLTISVLITVLLVRVLTVFVFDGKVWASYFLVGGIFSLGGLLLLSRREPRSGGEK